MQPISVKAKRMRFAFVVVVNVMMVFCASFASAWTRKTHSAGQTTRLSMYELQGMGAAHSNPEGFLDWRCMASGVANNPHVGTEAP